MCNENAKPGDGKYLCNTENSKNKTILPSFSIFGSLLYNYLTAPSISQHLQYSLVERPSALRCYSLMFEVLPPTFWHLRSCTWQRRYYGNFLTSTATILDMIKQFGRAANGWAHEQPKKFLISAQTDITTHIQSFTLKFVQGL